MLTPACVVGRSRSTRFGYTRVVSVCASGRSNGRVQKPSFDRLDRFVDDRRPTTTSQQRRLLGVERIDDASGYGFVAKTRIEPDTTLVSVPLERIIVGVDDDQQPVPWNVQMVEQLLYRLYNGTADAWMDALPGFVDLPFLYWSAEEVARLGDGHFIEEVQTLAEFVTSAGVREYLSAFDWEDVLWAFSMVHSRSFVCSQGQHLFAPLIDMANHSDDPNATVRLTFDVDRCQGQQALEEIAPPSTSSGERSVFELVTTRDVRPGEQVCISYGSQPNDVLLLYFGFCLPSNRNDAVVFTERDVAGVVGRDAGAGDAAGGRYFVTREGVDPGLAARLPSADAFSALCRRKLDQLRAIDDAIDDAGASSITPRAQAAAFYRGNKIALLNTMLETLS